MEVDGSVIPKIILKNMSYSQNDYAELIALAELAGINANPGVLRILIELLSLQLAPQDIYVLLKQICPQQKKRLSSTSKSKT